MQAPDRKSIGALSFSNKIPTKEDLMDFFVNQCGRYTPPAREVTALFAK